MKSVFKTSLVLCLLVLLFFAAAAIAQTCKPESIKATTPISRFTDNGDGTVTDKTTGLMWKKCSEGQSGADCAGGAIASYEWQGALQQAQAVNSGGGFAGYTDWRVPNIQELNSIVEEQCYDPAINLSVFPNTPSAPYYYWSSSPFVRWSNCSYSINFKYGTQFFQDKHVNGYVRLVRGGQ